MNYNGKPRLQATYEPGDTIKVPVEVHKSGEGKVVGVDWGPDCERGKTHGSSWVYLVMFPDNDEWLVVQEEEAKQWAQ